MYRGTNLYLRNFGVFLAKTFAGTHLFPGTLLLAYNSQNQVYFELQWGKWRARQPLLSANSIQVTFWVLQSQKLSYSNLTQHETFHRDTRIPSHVTCCGRMSYDNMLSYVSMPFQGHHNTVAFSQQHVMSHVCCDDVFTLYSLSLDNTHATSSSQHTCDMF